MVLSSQFAVAPVTVLMKGPAGVAIPWVGYNWYSSLYTSFSFIFVLAANHPANTLIKKEKAPPIPAGPFQFSYVLAVSLQPWPPQQLPGRPPPVTPEWLQQPPFHHSAPSPWQYLPSAPVIFMNSGW